MNRNQLSDYLTLAKEAALLALELLKRYDPKINKIFYSSSLPQELKSDFDIEIESAIINHLSNSGIPILSEESGLVNSKPNPSELLWVIDPLDGTLNFTREIGPSAVSIALFKNNIPILGVVVEFPSGDLYWGGPEIGACKNDSIPLKVSNITNVNHSIIYTGVPSRFKPSIQDCTTIMKIFNSFSKIRAIGCAAISLINVAKGNAECYFEKEIMIWDVGAGLAIVKGAGGHYNMVDGLFENSKIVVSANNKNNCNLFI